MSLHHSLRRRPKLLSAFNVVGLRLSLLFLCLVSACSVSKDRNDAQLIAASVHDKLIVGDFAGIYREAAPSFRSIGSESEFVAGLSGLQARLGSPKHFTELGYLTNLDPKLGRTHFLKFDLECEHGHARESLMFVRSPGGKMELWRLDIQPVNQGRASSSLQWESG